jgi:hypothetical protein
MTSTPDKSAEVAADAQGAPEKPAAKPVATPRARRTTTAAQPARRASAAKPKATQARKPAAAKAAPAAKPAPAKKPSPKAEKPAKAKKVKLVRDSFTMPDTEYALIALLKKRCLDAGVSAKKSEILRAAVAGLAKLSDASVVAAIRRLEVIKTGRPAKGSK